MYARVTKKKKPTPVSLGTQAAVANGVAPHPPLPMLCPATEHTVARNSWLNSCIVSAFSLLLPWQGKMALLLGALQNPSQFCSPSNLGLCHAALQAFLCPFPQLTYPFQRRGIWGSFILSTIFKFIVKSFECYPSKANILLI